jgi:hypothetical protein
MPNTIDQFFVCKCPNCAYPTSIQKSDIEEVPNDYLQCTRCKYIFSVSKLNDFDKLTADNFNPEELEYCKGIIPNQQ